MDGIDIKRLLLSFVLCVGIMIAWQSYMLKKNPPKPRPASAPASSTSPTSPVSSSSSGTPVADTFTQPQLSSGDKPATPVEGQWTLKAVEPAMDEVKLGSLSKESLYKSEITMDSNSGAVKSAFLSEYKLKVSDEDTLYPVLMPVQYKNKPLNSFMLGQLKIKGRSEVFDLSGGCWQQIKHEDGQGVSYLAEIVDDKDSVLFTIRKIFSYQPNDYQMDFSIELINKTIGPLEIESLQFAGPAGPILEDLRSDRRQTVAAFQPITGDGVYIEKYQLAQARGDDSIVNGLGEVIRKHPNDRMLWYGVSNKFFTCVLRPLAITNTSNTNYVFQGKVQSEFAMLEPDYRKFESTIEEHLTMATHIGLDPGEALASQQAVTMPFKIYLGPIDSDLFTQEPYAALYFENLLNTMACSACAFDWLTAFILKMLKWFYGFMGNYGIAIIILVLLVRLVLHPITKKGQVNMMSMSKAMAKIQPKMEEIKKKYAGNNAEIQKRTMALYKEQGVNPAAGCLGMIPMLIQMPIWIALYTAVDANVALRHEGLFPASFHWLTDLSAPDRLIPFSVLGLPSFTMPLNMGYVDAFNLLPILLTIAMYLQTKLTAQPTAATNPQMEQQQKIMRVMMPVMMLFFFYAAPSGLNLYIMASTFAGVIEQKRIRKHIEQEDAEKASVTTQATSKITKKMEPKKKKPKPPTRFN